ncbi:sensor histidine kinase [Zooshikella ganghwensis]|nr:ATP-binding protein [Zooshikella ganghwensis]
MNLFPPQWLSHPYWLALTTPILATVLAAAVASYLPIANVSLIYLTAVLLTALHTHTTPAILCSLISFLTYNFFFMSPRFTLEMIHQEEILTVCFFLLIALVVGRIGGRLRQQMQLLHSNDKMLHHQLQLAQQLSSCLSQQAVLDCLCQHINQVLNVNCQHYPPDSLPPLEPAALSAFQSAAQHAQPCGAGASSFSQSPYLFFPVQGDSVISVLMLSAKTEASPFPPSTILIHTFVQQAEQALRQCALMNSLQQEKMNNEREMLRSALLSSVSHDLRTPLATMIGSVSTLQAFHQQLSVDDQQELLTAILEEAKRLNRYVQNLLDMTRLGHGELKLERDWVTIEDIINVTLKRSKPLLQHQYIHVTGVQPTPLLYVHPALIEQALFNVVENAIKFTPKDGVIELQTAQQEDTLLLSVIDEGPGIPEDEREQIFDMFYTVSRGDCKPPGTGLGLAISQSILRAHGGFIEVTASSAPNTGATFVFHIPLPTQQPIEEPVDGTDSDH